MGALRLTVVIPTREPTLGPDNITIRTLKEQTYKDFLIVVQHDYKNGANWARNKGFELVSTELVMFCDDDINWNPGAIEKMIATLDAHPEASYVYCGYQMGNQSFCMRPFSPMLLKKINYISTMSIIRSKDFLGFDQEIKRFQDWDLWLNLLMFGKVGVWCESLEFTTEVRSGITFNNDFTPYKAAEAIKRKYSL